MKWGYLIHLSFNMWGDPGANLDSDFENEGVYHERLFCDRDIWDKVIAFLPSQGIDTVLIDIGDGIQFETHPEIAVPDAWTIDEFRKVLSQIREKGMMPIPKLNFSTCHDKWLKMYSRMTSTPQYYKVCEDLIKETCAIFNFPELFHLGMDEEAFKYQSYMQFQKVRGDSLWWHDLNYYASICDKCGTRPWIWSDYYWSHPDSFCKNMSKSFLQSNWFYEAIPSKGERDKRIDAFIVLDRLGYEQILTSSTFNVARNTNDTVRLGRNELNQSLLKGFLTAPWLPTIKGNYYGLLQDAQRLGDAKAKYYPD